VALPNTARFKPSVEARALQSHLNAPHRQLEYKPGVFQSSNKDNFKELYRIGDPPPREINAKVIRVDNLMCKDNGTSEMQLLCRGRKLSPHVDDYI
jgi:hypothetical protein